MELLERAGYIDNLVHHYKQVDSGNGHTIFLMGEAGVGKTSLVNHFVKKISATSVVYTGACDSLFTPRPLGPLLDIASEIGPEFIEQLKNEKDRSLIFASLVQKLSTSSKPVVLIFEDIHWADEATIDLIKFLARRIYRHNCLFLLTYRDDEIHARHPLAAIFGQLPSDNFSKVAIKRLSREAVVKLAADRGHSSGEQLYLLTEGNPFYVMEILANDSQQIPERVKDSILTVFYSKDDATRSLWEFLAILPSRIEPRIADRLERDFPGGIDACITSGVIVARPGYLCFKHELYRLTIEESLSSSRRQSLHKKMLAILNEISGGQDDLSQLVHHAKFADERALVATIAPRAAKEAASVGAHMEASKLYSIAIEYTDDQQPSKVELYERYAYECYLTNKLKEALDAQETALKLWQQRKINLREGDAMRFLSRLWWFVGDHANAMATGLKSIEVLENGFPTRERALAYSNLSQICMLSDDLDGSFHWGNKAIDLAERMNDQEILCHALNNVGTTLLKIPREGGEEKLNQSLAIALEHGFHEHVARAYVNLSSSFILIREYKKASAVFDVALKYCEERDLDSWKYYLQNCTARMFFETGKWDDAETVARRLQTYINFPTIVNVDAIATLAKLCARKGKFDEARTLIDKAKSIAWPTHEAQRIIPALTAELELCWLSGIAVPLDEIREAERTLFVQRNNPWHYTSLVYWMNKCEIEEAPHDLDLTGAVKLERQGNWRAAADLWKEIGCPYEHALASMKLGEEDQKHALLILATLGATATVETLKSKMKEKGVKSIPRGPRESTLKNPAFLTERQIEILVMLQSGSPNKEIADKLFISPKTVDHHITAILSKLDVNSRAKAVAQAHKLGILK